MPGSQIVYRDDVMGRDLEEEKARSWAENSTVPYVLEETITEALRSNVIGPAHLRMETLPSNARTIRFPKAKKHLAYAVSEGEELHNVQLEAESNSITADEIGFMTTITDRLENTDIASAANARMKQVSYAMIDKVDLDICKLFGSFPGTIGTNTATLKVNDILTGIAKLELNDAAGRGQLVAILHTAQVHDLRLDLYAQNTNPAFEQMRIGPGDIDRWGAAPNGMFGSLFGVPIYCTNNIPHNGTQYQGGLFIQNYALGMINGYMGKVETDRWIAMRANIMCVTSFYGLGQLEGRAGFQVSTKRTA